jgi:uncharacterized RDD family membrane protein YckC
MPYYVVKDGQRVGPLSDEEFQNRILSGEIGPDTLIWQAGMADWKRYAEHSGLEAPPPPEISPKPTFLTGPTGVCAECGNTFVRDELVSIAGASVCAGCKPLFLQRIREGASLPSAYRYAGFWIRVVAKFVDGMILGAMGLAVQLGIFGTSLGMAPQPGEVNFGPTALSWGLGMVIGVSYAVFFLGKFGATPGKMAVGIKVIRSDGAPITYGRAAGRFFAEYLSLLTIYIGYIMAGFDEEKRALHDHICDTRVVKN